MLTETTCKGSNMDLPIKFKIALIMSNMDYKKFGEQHGISKQHVSQTVAALSVGLRRSTRIEKAILEFTQSQMMVLRNILNHELAA